MSLSLSLHLLCTSYCLLSFVILSDQPLSGKHAMSCWSQLEATCLYFCHRLKEKRYVLGFSFRSRLLSYLYQVVQSSSCHHHEKRKRIMMQTVECRCSWWCRWPPSWWGWWGCRSFRWHRWPPRWCAASDLSGCGRPTIFSATYILSSLLYSFVSVTSSLLYCFVFCVLLALSPHPPVTMSPLQLVSKRPTHDSVVPLNIHWGMRASVEEEQVFQSSLYKDAPE